MRKARSGCGRLDGREVIAPLRRAVTLVMLLASAAAAQPTATTSATGTPTPTPSSTPSPTFTSCRGDLPAVEPVTSPTDLLEQTISFCGRIVESSFMTVSGGVGPTPQITSGGHCAVPCPNPGNASCNKATVHLAPNQTTFLTVCQGNLTCGAGGCVTVDRLGNALEILQVEPTPSVTPTATLTPTRPAADIPLVPSPGSPSGIAMAALLAAAIAWVLRTRALRR